MRNTEHTQVGRWVGVDHVGTLISEPRRAIGAWVLNSTVSPALSGGTQACAPYWNIAGTPPIECNGQWVETNACLVLIYLLCPVTVAHPGEGKRQCVLLGWALREGPPPHWSRDCATLKKWGYSGPCYPNGRTEARLRTVYGRQDRRRASVRAKPSMTLQPLRYATFS